MGDKKNIFKIDFIGIGEAKAGSTWVSECLKRHPQICFSSPKEVNFFNKKHGFHRQNEKWNYKKGINWYQKHFSHCKKNQIRGEFTPGYLFYGSCAKLIKKHFPDIKIIAILRNPTERAYSHYSHLKRKGKTRNFKNFKDAINKEPEFIKRGFYFSNLKRYYKLFPKKNILILIYEDIKDNPRKIIKNIYDFLCVKNDFIPSIMNKKINEGGGIRFDALNILLIKLNKAIKRNQVLWAFLKKMKFNLIYRTLKKINSVEILKKRKKELDQETRKELKKIFEKDINNLEKLINRNLSFWK